MLTLENFTKAREVLKTVIRPTNLIFSEYFSRTTGNQVYIKPENLQITGAYKIRGAFYKLSEMSAEQRKKGIITSSAGNHAQGIAYAAQLKRCKATIVMPTTTPLLKVNNTKRYGAEVVLHGDIYDHAYHHAIALAKEHGYEFVHPFDDLQIATGQGTIAFEILEDLDKIDIILVPIGGGGLAAGVATLAKILKPEIQVIGVEPTGAASMSASLSNGTITSLTTVRTIADGVAVQTPGKIVFPYIQQNLDYIITVGDTELPNIFLDLMENHKMIAETSGLLSLAAIRHLGCTNKTIASIITGGNIDVITMPSLLQHGLVHRSRVFTVSLHLPDRPGELSTVSGIIAQARGNVVKLEHNQFYDINRSAAVELRITIEGFGKEHKDIIFNKLIEAGYNPISVNPATSFY